MTQQDNAPFAFAPIARNSPSAPDFSVVSTTPVKTFAFGSDNSNSSTLSESSSSESSERTHHDHLVEHLTASGELFTSEQMARQLEQARVEIRQELQALHQQELDDQAERHDQAMVQLFDELQRWREAITHQCTELLLRLSETLTLHLMQQSLLEHPERYVTAVTPALKELMGFTRPRLYVPDFALGALTDRMQELKSLHPDHIDIEVLADESLDTGDFRLEVDGGQIDADLEKRLNHLVETCRQRALAAFAEWDDEHDEEELPQEPQS